MISNYRSDYTAQHYQNLAYSGTLNKGDSEILHGWEHAVFRVGALPSSLPKVEP